MIIRFDDKVVNKSPELFDYLQSNWLENAVTYVINSKYRKSVGLRSLLKAQVNNPSKAIKDVAELVPVPIDNKYDLTAIACLKAVKGLITYVGDQATWDMPEYWQTAEETITLKHGDCEDGAILMYVIARNAGIPANRLLLFAGDVIGGGHCCLFYKPDNYPLNWVALDWCYWYEGNSVGYRNMFAIIGNDITNYSWSNNYWSVSQKKYIRGWFFFNEDKSTLSVTTR